VEFEIRSTNRKSGQHHQQVPCDDHWSPLEVGRIAAFAINVTTSRLFHLRSMVLGSLADTVTLSADRWPDDLRPSDIEPRFVCRACGKRAADVRPDFNWNAKGPGRHEEFPFDHKCDRTSPQCMQFRG
jgi:hypothetical protein